ncbi:MULTISPECIES: SDR family oxidoreductase [Streptomyces]|uniref:SDR family oxidoreductase n=1 Tax=Streptomyces sp. LRE541 TaxID=2931983 RepID=UPI0032C48FE4
MSPETSCGLADIAEHDQIRRMAGEVWEAFGRLDVAVNNVGDVAREQMSWRDLTEESVDHVLAVDIKGTLLCTHEFGDGGYNMIGA